MIVLFFVSFGLFFFITDDLFAVFDADACARPRAVLSRGESPPTLLGPWEFSASIAFLVASMTATCLVWFGSRSLFYRLLTSSCFYAGVSCLLELTKHLLVDDKSCSTKANGISGHTSLFVFYCCLTLEISCDYLFIVDTNKRPALAGWFAQRTPQLQIHALGSLRVLVITFWLLACATLTSTWRGGYHSIRQMVYGGAWGSFAYLVIASLHKLDVRPTKFLSLLALFVAAAGVSFSFALPNIRPPVSTNEWVLVGIFWLVASFVRPAEPAEQVVPKLQAASNNIQAKATKEKSM